MAKGKPTVEIPGGFTILPNWVWEMKDLGRVDKLVYIALARFADNETRICWPSYTTLMYEAMVGNRRTLKNSLKRLELTGCIEIQRRKGFANLYHLPTDPPDYKPEL